MFSLQVNRLKLNSIDSHSYQSQADWSLKLQMQMPPPSESRARSFQHMTATSEFTIELQTPNSNIYLEVHEKYATAFWTGTFSAAELINITQKARAPMEFEQFTHKLLIALEAKPGASIDILTSHDLEVLRAKKHGSVVQSAVQSAPSNKPQKRYLILSVVGSDSKKAHYPLTLSPVERNLEVAELKNLAAQLRAEVEVARNSALNDTAKSDQSFSIQYDTKASAGKSGTRVQQVDQLRSQNQILRAKLSRLQQQAAKNKANIEVEAAVQKTRQLKAQVETMNLELVDWRKALEDQEEEGADLKREIAKLHKKICSLLTTEKQLVAKKKGEETEKQLNFVRNQSKKNGLELEKLKKQLEASKAKLKELELKAKKLTSEKEVLRRGGRRGPYSSTGSVRSYNSFSSKNSFTSNSKPKSNYSWGSGKSR